MYSPPLGRFLSRDPLPLNGEPDVLTDGDWFGDRLTMMKNLYAYVDNKPLGHTDPSGNSELSSEAYLKFIRLKAPAAKGIDDLWVTVLKHYMFNDPASDWCWDCEDDMEEIFEAFYQAGKETTLNGKKFAFQGLPKNLAGRVDLTKHFFAGAAFAATGSWILGTMAGIAQEIKDAGAQVIGKHKTGADVDDLVFTMIGSQYADHFDTWTESECRKRVQQYIDGKITLSKAVMKGMPVAGFKGHPQVGE